MHAGYNYQNEAGEPYMTAAELRFEAELDAQSAEERWADAWQDDDARGYDTDECDIDYDLDLHNGHAWCWTHDQNADKCEVDDNDDEYFMEDQHLDGMWEE